MSTLPIRYWGWMARDVAGGPGIPIVMLGTLGVALGLDVNSTAMLGMQPIGWAFVLLATAGIVSQDLVGGYYRTLFARPVSPAAYYLQRWLVGGVAVLVAVLLMDVALSFRFHTRMIGSNLLARAALAYLLLGGLVLLLSTVTRRDWVFAALLMTGHSVLDHVRTILTMRHITGFGPRVADAVYKVLPPFELIGLGQPVHWGRGLLYVALYGTGLLLSALLVLHRRPLGAGLRE